MERCGNEKLSRETLVLPVKAKTEIKESMLVVLDATGYAVPGKKAEGLVAAGVSQAYFCSFGIGGYCIPLAGKYLLQGSENKNMLSIVKEAVNFNLNYLKDLVSRYKIERYKHIGIFGLSYKENIKVSKGSPTIDICKLLHNYGKQIEVHDPYYNSKEIMEITGCKKINLASENNSFDCIILMVAHEEYKFMDIYNFAVNNSVQIIIDQPGIWNDNRWKNVKIKYVKVGEILMEVENDKSN